MNLEILFPFYGGQGHIDGAREGSPDSQQNSSKAKYKDLYVHKQKQAKIAKIYINSHYYMARACQYITRAVIGQYSGSDFPVMPTGIMSDVNARLVKRKYRKCGSTFDSNSWNDLKLNENWLMPGQHYLFWQNVSWLTELNSQRDA